MCEIANFLALSNEYSNEDKSTSEVCLVGAESAHFLGLSDHVLKIEYGTLIKFC